MPVNYILTTKKTDLSVNEFLLTRRAPLKQFLPFISSEKKSRYEIENFCWVWFNFEFLENFNVILELKISLLWSLEYCFGVSYE